jgi:hypothetical protein
MPPAYKTREDALAGLTSSFNPTTTDQQKAIADAVAQIPKAITSDAMNPTQPVVPTNPVQTTVPDVNSLQAQIDAYNKQNETPLPNQPEISSLQKDLMYLTGQYSQRDAFQSNLEADPALQAKRQQVLDLTNQANALIAESKAIPIRLQQEAQAGGANVTKGGLAPIQTAQLRNNAIQALSVSSLLSASQGNLSLALDQVDRAVKAKFDPIKAELDAKRANLEMLMNDPAITREEKRRADIAKLTLDKQEQEQKKAEEDMKYVKDYAIKLITMNPGMDSLSMSALQNAKTPQEIVQLANHLGLTTTSEKDQADIALTKAQTTLTKANTAKAYAEAEKAKNSVNEQGDTVGALAQQLVDGQLAPAELSKRTSGAGANYNSILKLANDLSMAQTGKPFNISIADRNYKYANNVQTINTLNYLGSLVGEDGQSGNLNEVKTLSNSITRTRFPALNDVAGWARLETGDPAIVAYKATVTEVADQIAKILQGGGTGSGTSDAKLAQASALLQSSFTKDQINATIDAITPLLRNRAKSIVSDNPYLRDYVTKLGLQDPTDNAKNNLQILQSGSTGQTSSGIKFTIQ